MQTSTLKRAAIFMVISIVLIVAVVGGIRWAKGRADFYAKNDTPAQAASQPNTQQPSTTAPGDPPATTSKTEEKTQSAVPPVQTPSTQQVDSSAAASAPATTHSQPSQVPATGPVDVLLPITSLAILAFAAVRYVQARRNLAAIR